MILLLPCIRDTILLFIMLGLDALRELWREIPDEFLIAKEMTCDKVYAC